MTTKVTLKPSDLITVLTYVFMDNFCPCLLKNLILSKLCMNVNIMKKQIFHKVEYAVKNKLFGF